MTRNWQKNIFVYPLFKLIHCVNIQYFNLNVFILYTKGNCADVFFYETQSTKVI